MKQRYLFVLLCVGPIGWAQAEIYKNVDADGHVTYSSTPAKGSSKLNLERLPVMSVPARARNNATPSDFPRIDSGTQRSRDNTRRKILGDELTTEEKLLAEARLNLKHGMENPEVYRDQDGNILRDAARHEEKINVLHRQVTLHEKNIEALKTELLKSK